MRDPQIEEKALHRLMVCKECPENNTKPEIYLSSRCKSCGCVLEAKARVVNGACPRGLWP